MSKKQSRLRDARIEQGLTIQELAAKAGLGWGIVQAIETGRIPGTFAAKAKLALALKRPFKEIWPETYAEVSAFLADLTGKKGRR